MPFFLEFRRLGLFLCQSTLNRLNVFPCGLHPSVWFPRDECLIIKMIELNVTRVLIRNIIWKQQCPFPSIMKRPDYKNEKFLFFKCWWWIGERNVQQANRWFLDKAPSSSLVNLCFCRPVGGRTRSGSCRGLFVNYTPPSRHARPLWTGLISASLTRTSVEL